MRRRRHRPIPRRRPRHRRRHRRRRRQTRPGIRRSTTASSGSSIICLAVSPWRTSRAVPTSDQTAMRAFRTIAAVTPAFPARAMILPFLVCALIAILKNVRLPALIRVPIYACCVAIFAMWPWSGIVARALPAFLRSESPSAGSRPVWIACGSSMAEDAAFASAVSRSEADGRVWAARYGVSGIRASRSCGWR